MPLLLATSFGFTVSLLKFRAFYKQNRQFYRKKRRNKAMENATAKV